MSKQISYSSFALQNLPTSNNRDKSSTSALYFFSPRFFRKFGMKIGRAPKNSDYEKIVHSKAEITKGVLAEESKELLEFFFQKIRSNK